MLRLVSTLLLVALAGCKGKLTHPPEITSESKEGSTELVFMMGDHRFGPDGGQSFSATGTLDARQVGFDIQLAPWTENPPGFINMSTWECKATIRSRGIESDRLVQFQARLYGTQLSPTAMCASVECKALSPWENPGRLEREPAKFILLFQGGFDETRDAEVWLEVRPSESRIILREKEPRFRRALILALAQDAG